MNSLMNTNKKYIAHERETDFEINKWTCKFTDLGIGPLDISGLARWAL